MHAPFLVLPANFVVSFKGLGDFFLFFFIPTTFFIGKNSSLYPVTGQTIIAKSVKKSQPIYFKRSGHTPLLTEPKKFSQEIRNFLNRLEAL